MMWCSRRLIFELQKHYLLELLCEWDGWYGDEVDVKYGDEMVIQMKRCKCINRYMFDIEF